MEVKAVAKYVGISPQKLGLVAEVARGKKVDEALALLKFFPTPGAKALAKVIKSAAANAENNFQMPPSELRVVKVLVNQGATLKRIRPQARGRANPILRHSSHITVIVDTEE
ncbi:MAG TPA: 50S ribosomal protein L22 [Dehalococcoidia bacterium]|nr:50S ribosomal protein L22 [Dehalococcoidia bacterium]